MKTTIRVLAILAIGMWFAILYGCGGGGSNATTPPVGKPDITNQVHQVSCKGRVEIPDSSMSPTDFKVVVPAGKFNISSNGEFEIPMNAETTGLILIVDSSGAPVLFKVFPKHHFLMEQEPVVNAESTAVAIMYLNPILAQYNHPLVAAAILELLRRTSATPQMADIIRNSLSQRRTFARDPHLRQLASQGVAEFFALAGRVQENKENSNSPRRSAQADDKTAYFFDRDGKDKDTISITGFTAQGNPPAAHFDYENPGFKWWMVTVDPTSPAPSYTPSYLENYRTPSCLIGFIPPASFYLPDVSHIIFKILADTIKSIINIFIPQKVDIIKDILQLVIPGFQSSKGEINFVLPKTSSTFQLSFYSPAFINDLGSTVPASPDRFGEVTILHILMQFVFPVITILYDTKMKPDVMDNINNLVKDPTWELILKDITPEVTFFLVRLRNNDPAAIDAVFAIIAKILNGDRLLWILSNFFGIANPLETLKNVLNKLIPGDLQFKICRQLITLIMSFTSSLAIPNFDNYIIDLTKIPSSGVGWARTWGGDQDDEGYTVAVDTQGNVYVVGSFRAPGNEIDVFLVKYDANGTLQWQKTWGSTENDPGYGLALDGMGNLYVTGSFGGTVDFDPSPTGVDYRTSNGSGDAFLSKFDINGNFIWVRTWGGKGIEGALQCAIDGVGNVYVPSFFGGNLRKFNPNGNELWYITCDVAWWSEVAVDAYGNILLPGRFSATVDFDPGPGVDLRSSNGDWDACLTKLSSSGTYEWTRTWGGPDWDTAYAAAFDSAGNAYTAGWFRGTVNFGPGATVASNGNADAFISKYSATGNFAWCRTWGGIGDDNASRIAVDAYGNLGLTGGFQDQVDFFPEGSKDIRVSKGDYDIFMLMRNTNGGHQWTRTWGGTGTDSGVGIAIDANGYVYVTGTFRNTVNFDLGSGVDNYHSNGGADVFLIKLKP